VKEIQETRREHSHFTRRAFNTSSGYNLHVVESHQSTKVRRTKRADGKRTARLKKTTRKGQQNGRVVAESLPAHLIACPRRLTFLELPGPFLLI
jgi:hypothetical protein